MPFPHKYFHLVFPSFLEAVGKSSLISTFVSRYFTEVGVPGIMTRVRLPPDPEHSCVTTIVDSQKGDAALLNHLSMILQNQQQQQLQSQQQQQQSQSSSKLAPVGGGGGGGGVSTAAHGATASTGGASATPATPGAAKGSSTAMTQSESLQSLVERLESSIHQQQQQQQQSASNQTPGASSASARISGPAALDPSGPTIGGGGDLYASSTTTSSLSSSTASAVAGIASIDSIILVYDLDRVETFFRLESHWLPLIERCYNGKVRHMCGH